MECVAYRAACDTLCQDGPDNLEAEFAVVVRSDLKGRGLGHILLAKMIAYLKGKGTRRMVGVVLRENLAMRELALAQGMELDSAGSDTDTLRFVLQLSPSD